MNRAPLNFWQFIGLPPGAGLRERPVLSPDFESVVPGLFVVGDLGTASVLKLALQQGWQVGTTLSQQEAPAIDGVLDAIIVGAGPAGIAAATVLHQNNRKYLVLEKDQPFATLLQFPAGKVLYAEPDGVSAPPGFAFGTEPKEDIVARWAQHVASLGLAIHSQHEVVDGHHDNGTFTVTARRADGSTVTFCARALVLALGKRSQPNTLEIPGEDLPHVAHTPTPVAAGSPSVVIVGGGDSAVEAALSALTTARSVALVVRTSTLHRPRRALQRAVAEAEANGTLTVLRDCQTTAITPQSVNVAFADGLSRVLPADEVRVLTGSRPPRPLLRRLGITYPNERRPLQWLGIGFFALTTVLFYLLKGGKDWFPFGGDDPWGTIPTLLRADLGFRTVDASFWGTVVYSLLITVTGLRLLPTARPRQQRRLMSLLTFQLVFLFGIPELIAPLWLDRPWKVYALTVPWPLSTWSLIDAPSWVGSGSLASDTWTALGWLGAAAAVTFGAIPLYVRSQGLRFCSYLCGCGGLAETFGDAWRHLAPRGASARTWEWGGRVTFALAIPVTVLVLLDAWALLSSTSLRSAADFGRHWYALMVDFGLASIVGVALYPVLGNRVWCRFFCPLRTWMEWLARKTGRLGIQADERCIGCDECSISCQMGIDVRRFAQSGERLDNTNSSCIQCGVCIDVCPMDVLTLDAKKPVGISFWEPPRPSWEGKTPPHRIKG